MVVRNKGNGRAEFGTIFRQGDVALIRTKKPTEATKEIPREGGCIVLAHGEQTGHRHAIADLGARFVLAEATSRRFLEVKRGGFAMLRHEEHSEIQLPAGNYEVRIQKEYVPGGFRSVAD